jgi:hypothetical protein
MVLFCRSRFVQSESNDSQFRSRLDSCYDNSVDGTSTEEQRQLSLAWSRISRGLEELTRKGRDHLSRLTQIIITSLKRVERDRRKQEDGKILEFSTLVVIQATIW